MLNLKFETKYYDTSSLREFVIQSLGNSVKDSEQFTVECGIWEERDCTLVENDLQNSYSFCPVHSVKVAEVEYIYGYWNASVEKTIRTESFYVTPRVLSALNEGGHASTGICVDCLLESLQE